MDGSVSWHWRLTSLAILVATTVIFFTNLGDRAVISEEVRWAEIAREMRQSGDYLVPRINGKIYFDKPVGSYWFIVAVSYLTGEVDEATARAPAALAGILGVAMIILLGRRLYDERTSLYAGVILATCYGFAFYARRATADIETVTGVLLAICLYERNRQNPAGPWVILLWVGMAALSLLKGLLGFALPIAVIGAHGLWSTWADRHDASGRGWLSRLLAPQAWLLNRWSLLAIPLAIGLYLLPFLAASGQPGTQAGLEMVWRENIRRFVAPHNHRGPVYLYLGVIFLLAAPWSLFLPAALIPPRPATSGDRLARVYFWAMFLFFTASASRRSYYLLPVLPASALLIAKLLATPREDLSLLAARLRSCGWGLLGLLLLASGVLLIPPGKILPPPYNQLPELPGRIGIGIAWGCGLVMAILGLVVRNWPRTPITMLGVFVAYYLAFAMIFPAFDDLRTRKDFLLEVRDLVAATPDRLGLYHASDTVFDLGRITPEYNSPEALKAAVASGQLRWLILPRKVMDTLPVDLSILREESLRAWESAEHSDNKLVLLVFEKR